MPDRWIRICRRLAPARLCDRVFDPAIEDLALVHVARRRDARGRLGRFLVEIRWCAGVLAIAVECRRLSRDRRPLSTEASTSTGDSMLRTWFTDLRHAFRRFQRQPLFALIATLTLALGIGANAATFGFVNNYLLARLPVPDADRVLRVDSRTADHRFDTLSYPNYTDARDAVAGQLDVAAHILVTVLAGADDAGDSSQVELVTGNYFRVMAVAPLAGRLLDDSDDMPELAHPVVVLSEAYWRAKFGADPGVVGRSLRLNGAPYVVIGIAPGSFRGSAGVHPADLWAPVSMQQWLRPRGNTVANRGWGWLEVIGRLAPSSTPAAAQAALARVSADLNRQYESKYGSVDLVATPATVLPARERGALAPYLMMTLAFTGLLLVVTCANLAGVMQARVVGRRRELAIRQSLGAGRWRLVSAWLAESALLAVAGGFAGLLVARATILVILRALPPAALIGDVSISAPIDWSVVAFAGGLSLAAAVLIGLVPALRAAAAQPLSLLKDETSTATGGRGGARLRRISVLVQVATSTVLLLASGLLVGSLRNLQQFDPGFPTDHLALVSVDLRLQRVPAREAGDDAANLVTRARALPGVISAAIAISIPLSAGSDSNGFRIPGYTAPNGSPNVSIDNNQVSAGYFETLGLTFVRGRTWDAQAASPHAVVINETMARRFWPGQDPVGHVIDMIGAGPLTITGVVSDSVYYDVGEKPIAFVYLPAEATTPRTFTLVARTSMSSREVGPLLKQAVTSVDPRARPFNTTTFEDARAGALYPRLLLATAASTFGALALLLTGVGLYGVVAASVGQRTREIGVRVALGASVTAIQSGVLRESIRLVGVGSLAGFAGGYALAAALRQWLFGMAPFNVWVYVGVAVALTSVALVAAWVPARRASEVDPVEALRA